MDFPPQEVAIQCQDCEAIFHAGVDPGTERHQSWVECPRCALRQAVAGRVLYTEYIVECACGRAWAARLVTIHPSSARPEGAEFLDGSSQSCEGADESQVACTCGTRTPVKGRLVRVREFLRPNP